MTKTYIARFADGTVVRRRSDADYVAATRDEKGRVRFHRAGSDYRTAGRDVVAVETDERTAACVVCAGTGHVASRSAVTGAVTYIDCWRCR